MNGEAIDKAGGWARSQKGIGKEVMLILVKHGRRVHNEVIDLR
jgi:hypothetical protein